MAKFKAARSSILTGFCVLSGRIYRDYAGEIEFANSIELS
jgi:hypothetical protein